MAIAVVCPACGRRFRVEEHVAGKRLRCPCGQRLVARSAQQAEQVTSAIVVPEEDDWVAAAFASPEPPEGKPSEEGQAPTPPPLPLPIPQEDEPGTRGWTASPPAGALGDAPRDLLRHLQSALLPARNRSSKAAMQRLAIARLAMAYGSLVTLVLATRLFLDPPAGIFALSNRVASIVLAACVAVGGWLILKRHPQGPAWAGLASVFLCFPFAWSLLMSALGYYSAGQWRWLGAVLLKSAVQLAIPGLIIAWCLKKEVARQRQEQEREEQERPF